MKFARELAVALEAADLASRLILDHYERLVVIPDAPASITTDTDRQSQETILSHLHGAFPTDALLAEENTPTAAASPRSGARLWIIDPIDGTRGFARKNGEFSVMIAFLQDGVICVGVVLEPAKNRNTYASLGGGCWRPGRQGAGRCVSRNLHEIPLGSDHNAKPCEEGRPRQRAGCLEALAGYRDLFSRSQACPGRPRRSGDLSQHLRCVPRLGHRRRPSARRRSRRTRHQPPGRIAACMASPGAWQPHGLVASNKALHESGMAALAAAR